jgi:RNA polymerase sigma-70 factor (ECF subfamily)
MSTSSSNSTRHEEFVALYVRHEPAVFSFVLGMVGRSADAEDVVQRASMTMWRCFDRFKPGTNFRNWAFQVAKNEALNYLTRARRDRHVFSEKMIELLASDNTEEADKLEARRRALDSCVEKLPQDDHEIVTGSMPKVLPYNPTPSKRVAPQINFIKSSIVFVANYINASKHNLE